MRSTHILAAAAGLAALASPLTATAADQMSSYGWIIRVQDPVLAPAGHSSGLPQMTTIEVYAKFDDLEHYAFAMGDFDFIASENGIAGVNWIDNTLVAPFDLGAAGLLQDNGAVNIMPGQLHFPPAIIGDDSNIALVWTINYTATDFTKRAIDFGTLTRQFAVYDDAFTDSLSFVDPVNLWEGEGGFRIIPAPGAAALLGLGGLIASRRRR